MDPGPRDHASDPFAPGRWEAAYEPVPAAAPHRRRPRQAGRFLKGPVPWPWLRRAMALPGKAVHVGLLLWHLRGMTGRRTVHLCLARAAAEGIPVRTARRAMQALEQAGLVAVERRPGRG